MLSARWISPKCMKPDVSTRHHSPLAVAPGIIEVARKRPDLLLFIGLPDWTTVTTYARTFSAIIACVMIGLPAETTAPADVRAWRTERAPSFTQSTHCMPTEASRRHSGHIGRSHLVQSSRVGRSV